MGRYVGCVRSRRARRADFILVGTGRCASRTGRRGRGVLSL